MNFYIPVYCIRRALTIAALFLLVVYARNILALHHRVIKEVCTMLQAHTSPHYDKIAFSMMNAPPQHDKVALSIKNNINRNGYSYPTQLFLEENKFSSSIECRLALEKTQKPLIDRWFQLDIPTLESVRTFGGYHYVLMGAIPVADEKLMSSEWYCGSMTHKEKYTATIHSEKWGKTAVKVLTFPETNNITHIWPSVPANQTGVIPFYDLRHFQTCDKLEKQEYMSAHAHDNDTVDVKIGGCQITRGMLSRRVIAEWIAYHRLIGYHHFWIYINEAWNLKDLPRLPYVTYVPYNYQFSNHKKNVTNKDFLKIKRNTPIQWQVPMQMDCLYRAKELGLDWITTTDSDEFIHVRDARVTASSIVVDYPLRNFLRAINQSEVAALTMNSIPFGKNIRIKESSKPGLTLDFVWRTAHNISNFKKSSRRKNIYSVKLAESIDVHWLWYPPKASKHLFPENKVYVHHYKRPFEGIFENEEGVNLIEDTELHDKYRSQVLAMMGTFLLMNETTTK